MFLVRLPRSGELDHYRNVQSPNNPKLVLVSLPRQGVGRNSPRVFLVSPPRRREGGDLTQEAVSGHGPALSQNCVVILAIATTR